MHLDEIKPFCVQNQVPHHIFGVPDGTLKSARRYGLGIRVVYGIRLFVSTIKIASPRILNLDRAKALILRSHQPCALARTGRITVWEGNWR